MTIKRILEAIRRSAESSHAWRSAALDVGTLLANCSAADLDELLSAFPELADDTTNEWVRGARQMLIDVVSGVAQERMAARDGEIANARLRSKVGANKRWIDVARQIAAADDGVARHKDLAFQLEMDKGQLTKILDAMLEAELLVPVPVVKGDDQRLRLCVLSRAGRTLAEQLHTPQPAAVVSQQINSFRPSHEHSAQTRVRYRAKMRVDTFEAFSAPAPKAGRRLERP